MVHAAIFDLDGMLIDSESITFRIYNDILREQDGGALPLETYANTYSGRMGSTNMEELIRMFHLPITFDEGRARQEELEEAYWEDPGVPLKPGAKALLAYLKAHGVKILLATSSRRVRAERALRLHDILSFFDDIVTGWEVERGKPFPDVFLKAAEKAGEAPADCLVLEDSEAGIQAAHAAGIPVICVPDLRQPAETFARWTAALLPSLAEVVPWLEEHNGKTVARS